MTAPTSTAPWPLRLTRRWIVINCIVVTCIVSTYLSWNVLPYTSEYLSSSSPNSQAQHTASLSLPDKTETHPLPCASLPGASDVLVVLKTGVTAIQKRLPVHFDTTFRCIPNYAIFSDAQETFMGHHIYDALDALDSTVLESHDQLATWRHFQSFRDPENPLAELDHEYIINSTEKGAAWGLDKWKFLPLMEKTYAINSKAKWFVFIEADTHLVWSNLLRWLSHLDHEEDYFLGAQTYVGDTIFAHGGSGFILSSAAMHKLIDHMDEEGSKKMAALAESQYYGDAVLAMALKDAGVNLTWSWPLIQGHTPFTMEYNEAHWCRPAVTYHHVQADEIVKMWDFEQEWLEQGASTPPITNKEVFKALLAPRLLSTTHPEEKEWDNLSRDTLLTNQTLPSCRQTCQNRPSCVQYMFHDGDCHISAIPRLGNAAGNGTVIDAGGKKSVVGSYTGSGEEGTGFGDGSGEIVGAPVSGWLRGKIRTLMREREECRDGVEWIKHVPEEGSEDQDENQEQEQQKA